MRLSISVIVALAVSANSPVALAVSANSPSSTSFSLSAFAPSIINTHETIVLMIGIIIKDKLHSIDQTIYVQWDDKIDFMHSQQGELV
jgi:hypothetical protein